MLKSSLRAARSRASVTPAAEIPASGPDTSAMHARDTNLTLAVFLDLENIVRGAIDAHFPPFDIGKVFERLLLKGHIVVKKAYCDFERFKDFRRPLHETAFELIEIPHVRQSGKNSADIRMVVDALDLCYTNPHVDAFAIISGDSDFSPLVSKLRENGKTVIGLGVKNSTSDLFISNCDEFIYYDDLVRPEPRRRSRGASASAAPKAQPEESKGPDPARAIDMLVATVQALNDERGDDEVWASMVKQAIKRRNPGFNERAFGFGSFTDMLKDAEKRGRIELHEKSGNWHVRPSRS